MKKNLFKILGLTLLSVTIFSCVNNSDSTAENSSATYYSNTKINNSENFLENWENMDFLYINENGRLNTKIDAPWNKNVSSTLLPNYIRMDVKKEEGWDIAFNLMNMDGDPDLNYFGLYNKYTGVLRIFYYNNNDVTGAESDFSFEIILGADDSASKTFYNSLCYGMPNDINVNTNINILGSGANKTFHLLVTPYSAIGRSTLYKGWLAFDIDMSAYTGQQFVQNGGDIQIACKATNKTNVCLGTDISGKILGSLTGTIDRTSMMASVNGVGGGLSILSSILGGTGDSSLASLEAKICTGPLASLNQYSLMASTVFNVASKAWDYIVEGGPKIPQDKLNGKLNLQINAHADTTGYFESTVATNVRQITLGKTAFNPKSNIGKGVWQIDTAPKIYVIDDRAICDTNATSADERKPKNNVKVSQPKIYENLYKNEKCFSLWRIWTKPRIPYFYDPTSFNVIINPEFFPDASDIKVLTYCGIYTNQDNTRDAAFRSAINMPKPVPKAIKYPMPSKNNWKKFDDYINDMPNMGGTGNPNKWSRRFVLCSQENYKKADVKFVENLNYQSFGNENAIHYYGQIIQFNNDRSLPCNFIIEPQIFYPCLIAEYPAERSLEEVGKDLFPAIYSNEVSNDLAFNTDNSLELVNFFQQNIYRDIKEFPELYVIVSVQFKSGGETYFYSRKYLPKIENVTFETAQKIASQIQTRASNQPEKLQISEYVTSINKKMQILTQNDF